ncbi:hypothetical protein FSARC_3645 [Fusarium sarcochroum]|uniref:NmrA-like domain-containing protein n=1 Tax=Fusarium sarcochroum TaxID=1208366 RepID=A0A8H4U377_9HYPO|nr:hypothetical protein FSARC_3645 [Fusarium sarcochroum]
MATIKVAILGATGATGSSIVNGLLQSSEPRYEITALTRPSSLEKPAVQGLKQKGINVVAADLEGPEAQLAEVLRGQEVVISAIDAAHLLSQIPLANASKAAGVGRFVPCFFATAAPPKGVMKLRDIEDVLNHIKQLYLPYTVIDVGWWYQITLPRLPSGRIDYAVIFPTGHIAGDGNAPSALTDVSDIGRYTARIIADPLTLNQMVFAYSELYTPNQVYDLLEQLSGEKIKRNYKSSETIEQEIAALKPERITPDHPELYALATVEYGYSWGVRGDNNPQYAKYLGYLLGNELYPDMKGKPFEQYCKEVLDGKGVGAYGSN